MPRSDKLLLNARLQYVINQGAGRSLGLYWEIYNLPDRVNFDNPVGDRRSRFFGTPNVADDGRSMQLGLRYSF
jgi:hypothetical protein